MSEEEEDEDFLPTDLRYYQPLLVQGEDKARSGSTEKEEIVAEDSSTELVSIDHCIRTRRYMCIYVYMHVPVCMCVCMY